MLELFKKSFGIYKDNFKLLFMLSLFNSLFNILHDFLFLYKNYKYIKALYITSSLLTLIISDIIFIMTIYAISTQHSKKNIPELICKGKERFWRLVGTEIKILFYGILFFLLFIPIYFLLKIIKLPFNYITLISCIITIIAIYLEAQFIFAQLAAILEDKNIKPFKRNAKLVKGNFKNLFMLALITAVCYIPFRIINICLPDASLLKFSMQLIAQLLICSFYPFIYAYSVIIYEETLNKTK